MRPLPSPQSKYSKNTGILSAITLIYLLERRENSDSDHNNFINVKPGEVILLRGVELDLRIAAEPVPRQAAVLLQQKRALQGARSLVHLPLSSCDSFYNLPSMKMTRKASFGYGKNTDLEHGKHRHNITPSPDNYQIDSFVEMNKSHSKGMNAHIGRDVCLILCLENCAEELHRTRQD